MSVAFSEVTVETPEVVIFPVTLPVKFPEKPEVAVIIPAFKFLLSSITIVPETLIAIFVNYSAFFYLVFLKSLLSTHIQILVKCLNLNRAWKSWSFFECNQMSIYYGNLGSWPPICF